MQNIVIELATIFAILSTMFIATFFVSDAKP